MRVKPCSVMAETRQIVQLKIDSKKYIMVVKHPYLPRITWSWSIMAATWLISKLIITSIVIRALNIDLKRTARTFRVCVERQRHRPWSSYSVVHCAQCETLCQRSKAMPAFLSRNPCIPTQTRWSINAPNQFLTLIFYSPFLSFVFLYVLYSLPLHDVSL